MPEQTPLRRVAWWDHMEDYNPGGTVVLAQRLHDEGLVVAVNRLVLHPAGLAIGVRARTIDDPPVVQGLAMFATDYPDGIEYADDGQADRGVERLDAAGHGQLAARVRDGDAGLLRAFAEFVGADVDLVDEFLAP